MGFGNGKISGHSGTEFKHRVLFKDIKNHLRKTHKTKHIPTGNQRTVSPYKYKEVSKLLKVVSASLAILVIIFTATLIYNHTAHFIFDTPEYTELKNERITAQNKQQDKDRSFNYDYYMTTGDLHYYKDNNVAAQANYKEALKYLKDDYAVYGKYTISLCEQCYKDGENCEGAEEYLKFSRNHQLLDSDKIKYLESLLASATRNYATVQ